jgi:UDP-N-acetyl-D-galactosamine dehydrogenase
MLRMSSGETITTTDKICPELIVVIGVGYVGLELVQTFSRYYKVIGYDISAERINYLNETYKNENVTFQTTLDGMRGAELYLISATTLLDSDGNVDLKYVKAAIKNVLNLVTPYSTVCIESSVAVGTTRSLCLEFLEKKVYVGFSPERIDPGRTNIEGNY